MKISIIILIGIVAVVAISTITIGGALVGIYNTQAELKVHYDMKLKDNTSQFDNMWKKIKQVVEVPEAKKDALVKIFTSNSQARTGTGDKGSVMNWIKEAVPNVDMSIYDNVVNIITASRDSWTMRQTELVGIAEQYNQNLATFPNNVILKLFGFTKIDPTLVTSTRTEKSFETGKDDDTTLYNKTPTE